jgi:hypothetical protein
VQQSIAPIGACTAEFSPVVGAGCKAPAHSHHRTFIVPVIRPGDACQKDAPANRPQSALGQKRTSKHVRAMSALPPRADIAHFNFDVAMANPYALRFG